MSRGVKTPRNLLCEIGPLNGDREEKNTPFSGETSTTPFNAVYLKTDPFRRFFWTRVRSKSYGEWPPRGTMWWLRNWFYVKVWPRHWYFTLNVYTKRISNRYEVLEEKNQSLEMKLEIKTIKSLLVIFLK